MNPHRGKQLVKGLLAAFGALARGGIVKTLFAFELGAAVAAAVGVDRHYSVGSAGSARLESEHLYHEPRKRAINGHPTLLSLLSRLLAATCRRRSSLATILQIV